MAKITNLIDTYTIPEAKEEIKNGIRGYLAKDENGNYLCKNTARLPFYLEGAPGIGKTEMVRQIADELGIGFVSFSITHHTRNSLIGLPVIRDIEETDPDGTTHPGKYTEYTMSELIARPMKEYKKGKTEGILLLDEFNCASEIIMPTMLAFLQTRNIGMYTLPENWIICLCGNPSTYNESAKSFSAAILDRVRRLNIRADLDSFLSYGETANLHPLVLSYLSENTLKGYEINGRKEELEVVTYRGWENLSLTLKAYEKIGVALTVKTVYQFIKAQATADSFFKYYQLNHSTFTKENLNEVLAGENFEKNAEILNREQIGFKMDVLSLFEGALTASARAHATKVVSAEISNVFHFLDLLEDGSFISERFYHAITDNEKLFEVVERSKNEEYLSSCRKAYGLVKKGA